MLPSLSYFLFFCPNRIGEDVKALVKGKVSAYAGPVEKVFSPAHVTLSFSNKGEMDESVIRDKVRKREDLMKLTT